jgi:hypothetical protein
MDARFTAFRRCLPILLLLLATALPFGPAHARSTGPFMGYTGVEWADDFGITRGRCSREAVGKALADPRAATPGQSPVAVFAGLDLDDADRACAAHALELARHGRTVRWSAGKRQVSISIGDDAVANGLPCRPFTVRTSGRTTRGLACQAQVGVWEVTTPKAGK